MFQNQNPNPFCYSITFAAPPPSVLGTIFIFNKLDLENTLKNHSSWLKKVSAYILLEYQQNHWYRINIPA
jgi:hypothetical protein